MGRYAQLFQIRVKQDGDEYRAQEAGSRTVGTGETVQDAIIDYAEKAKERVES
ncbi:hypothetical protein [Haloarchaeobius litoreus]|uniref:Uncharacterized protein n=1 Tax=Haloarchaeobius litoreus TaxID=755306 RepID=A0ABD6DDS7_9EURY|nr:hypothetical protein [Haloarchaeobius litoreus]